MALAGFALRRLHRLHTSVPGGLRAAPVLLDLLCCPAAADGHAPADEARTVRKIARDAAIPRESARRMLMGLSAVGWVRGLDPAGYQATAEARRWWAAATGGPREFLWVAQQVNRALSVQGRAADDLLENFPWHIALATKYAEVPHPPYAQDCNEELSRLHRLDAAHQQALCALVDGYMWRHVRRLWPAFDADLMLPLMIGEIAHRNISALARRTDATQILARLESRSASSPRERGYLPINAHSVSVSLQVAGSTTRRRLAQLVDHGWISMDEDGTLALASDAIRAHTADLNAASLADFLATHEQARALIAAG
ncbi:MAG TPA: hypothetical protein PK326_01500 [Burkholderiaceae bacterium]|nr:hypothetical protein [Burkholderiaceae bacterium]